MSSFRCSKKNYLWLILLTILTKLTHSQQSLNTNKTRLGDFDLESATNRWRCTNGLDPNQITLTRYLKLFAKGPCSPVATIAGISGTKLKLVIENCNKLRDERPDIFSACLWKSCNKYHPLSPAKEYLAWVPVSINPLNIFLPYSKTRKCFSLLFGVEITKSNSLNNFDFKSAPGVKIIPEGLSQSTNTYSKTKCGANGIENIVPWLEHFEGFKKIHKKLEEDGYVFGVTAQAIPYDWRKSANSPKLAKTYKNILKGLRAATGKPVSIIAHSFGNLVTMNLLWSLNLSQKEKLIKRLYSIAPPFLGTPIMNSYFLGGTAEFDLHLKFLELGLDYDSIDRTLLNFQSTYQLLYRDPLEKNFEKKWAKTILNRILKEKGKWHNPNLKLKVIPESDENCQSGFSSFNDGCELGIENLNKIGKIEGYSIKSSFFEEALKNFSFKKESFEIYEQLKDLRYDNLKNPEVEIALIFANHLPTISGFEFKSNPFTLTSKKQTVTPEYTYSRGDGSVVATSSLLPALKWMQDFEFGVNGARPLHLLQFCGNYQKISSMRDLNPAQENSFRGLDCKCNEMKEDSRILGEKCNHPRILSDERLIEFLIESITSELEKGEIEGVFYGADEQDLQDYKENCGLLLQKERICKLASFS